MVITKKVKIFPRKYIFIPGVLINGMRIDRPCIVMLNIREIRKCMVYATVYEVVDKVGDILLTPQNIESDNSSAKPSTDVPNVELWDPYNEQNNNFEKDDEDEKDSNENPENDEDESQSNDINSDLSDEDPHTNIGVESQSNDTIG